MPVSTYGPRPGGSTTISATGPAATRVPSSSTTASGLRLRALRRPCASRSGTGATASRVTPLPYRPIPGGTPASWRRDSPRARPAARPAGSAARPPARTSASRPSRTRGPRRRHEGGDLRRSGRRGRGRGTGCPARAGRGPSRHLDLQRQPGLGVDPDVDPAHRRRRRGRDQPQPEGVAAGHPAGTDPGQLVVGRLRQQPPAQGAGQQVRRRGQLQRVGRRAGGGRASRTPRSTCARRRGACRSPRPA